MVLSLLSQPTPSTENIKIHKRNSRAESCNCPKSRLWQFPSRKIRLISDLKSSPGNSGRGSEVKHILQPNLVAAVLVLNSGHKRVHWWWLAACSPLKGEPVSLWQSTAQNTHNPINLSSRNLGKKNWD